MDGVQAVEGELNAIVKEVCSGRFIFKTMICELMGPQLQSIVASS